MSASTLATARWSTLHTRARPSGTTRPSAPVTTAPAGFDSGSEADGVRAATIADRALVVADQPGPVPDSGQLLRRPRAAGVNAADLLQVQGRHRAPPGRPSDLPGFDLAGEAGAV